MWLGICEVSGNPPKTGPDLFAERQSCALALSCCPSLLPKCRASGNLHTRTKTEPSISVLHRKHSPARQMLSMPGANNASFEPRCMANTGAFPVNQMPGNLLPAGGASALAAAHSFPSAADRCAGGLSKGLRLSNLTLV